MNNSPSCTCCGGGGGEPVGQCAKHGGSVGLSSPWSIKSGSWFPAGFFGAAHTNSSNAANILQPLPAFPGWHNNFRWVVSPLIANARTDTVVDGHRLIFSWQNQSNFWYADLVYQSTVADASAPAGTAALYELRLVEVLAGSATTHRTISFTIQNLLNSIFSPPRPYTPYPTSFGVCLQNGWLSIDVGSGATSPTGGSLTLRRVLQVSLLPPAGLFGVGAHSAANNSVGWGGWDLWLETLPPVVCKKCANGICCEGYELPETVTMTLTNLSPPFDVWNGAYVAPLAYNSESTQPNNPSGCFWWLDNALANPYPGEAIYHNRIEVSRQPNVTPPDFGSAKVTLSIGYVNRAAVTKTATSQFRTSDPFTDSPCHDQWANPLTFNDMSGSAQVVGNL